MHPMNEHVQLPRCLVRVAMDTVTHESGRFANDCYGSMPFKNNFEGPKS